ncbi:MAG: SagB/ThcOx family dehydrogenase [bacterium]|nr:SagB/ThcOx family dehydrogenase [bacterium]
MDNGIGDRFQEETKYHRDRMPAGRIDWDNQPDIYKAYPDAKTVELIAPQDFDSRLKTATFDDILRKRRSVRSYAPEPITLEQLSYLCWATTGKQREERGHQYRTVPSAGALYPIETYLTVNAVEGVQSGIYHYSVKGHQLDELRISDFGADTARAALGQKMCAKAPVVFIWTAIFERCKWKYGRRAYRYILLDAGHIGHSLALAAVALGLGSCQIAALYDNEVNELLNVDGTEESVIYMSVAGHPE